MAASWQPSVQYAAASGEYGIFQMYLASWARYGNCVSYVAEAAMTIAAPAPFATLAKSATVMPEPSEPAKARECVGKKR